jgi:hypothetical protein
MRPKARTGHQPLSLARLRSADTTVFTSSMVIVIG